MGSWRQLPKLSCDSMRLELDTQSPCILLRDLRCHQLVELCLLMVVGLGREYDVWCVRSVEQRCFFQRRNTNQSYGSENFHTGNKVKKLDSVQNCGVLHHVCECDCATSRWGDVPTWPESGPCHRAFACFVKPDRCWKWPMLTHSLRTCSLSILWLLVGKRSGSSRHLQDDVSKSCRPDQI